MQLSINTTSGQMISQQEDIMLEILGRLPKKSQARFKVVSKKWESLIEAAACSSINVRSLDAGFAWSSTREREQHFYRLDSKGGLTLEHSRSFNSWTAIHMGSCNGLIFYGNGNFGEEWTLLNFSYYLYNPLSKQTVCLPPHYDYKMSDNLIPSALGLVLDDPNSSTINHYKFVIIFWSKYRHLCTCPSRGLTVSIFSSRTGRWETKQAKFDNATFEYLELQHHGWGPSRLHFNGSLYWILPKPSCLMVFCVESGSFKAIELPPPRSDESENGVLWESEGRLYYCQICDWHGFCIWILDDDSDRRPENAPGDEYDFDLQYLPWRKTFQIHCDTMMAMLCDLCEEESDDIGVEAFFYGVSSFNEHLQIVHLDSTKGLVRFDIAEKKMTLVSHRHVQEVAFTYRAFDLPDYPIVPELPSGTSISNRKRKFISP